ncbi:MAG TPA: methionyl-tRNA formyltransferase [Deltaproteobacteria bacterium]|jgi:methionyl-tRNA formyltransferase|nr:methionyl-tRNA formyltransferase [Deltaproteobacteria bacterium]
MRIILIGQAPFGATTFEALLDAGEDVVAAYTPLGKPGAKPDPLKEAALAKGIRNVEPKTYRDEQVFSEFAGLRPDLVVLAFVTDIVPARYFSAAGNGAICYHPSILPRHRGASAINWALIMGDKRTGLTIFWPDEGIDTGPILLQKEVDIGPQDTAGSLYFNSLFPMGVEAIVESVKLIREGKAHRIAQDDSKATYEPPCDDRVAGLDWNSAGRQVCDLIRGCDPQPGAYAQLHGEKVRFYGAGFVPGKIGGEIDVALGTITGLDLKGVRIAVAGGELLVAKVRTASAGKIDAASWAAAASVKPGDRFGKFSK